MSEKHYKTITVTKTKRVRVKDLHFINGNLADITFQERRRVRVKKPVKPRELTFHNGTSTIIWENSSMGCTPATFQLVFQLWETPERFLSKEAIKEVVMDDEEAKDQSVHERIRKARIELRQAEFPYEIETERGKGYRLTSHCGDQYATFGIAEGRCA